MRRRRSGRARTRALPGQATRSRSRKRLTAQHKARISRSLKSRGNGAERLKNVETASKIVRNLSLAAETPSKIARNASLTAKSLSSLTYGVDRNLNRIGRGTRSLDATTRSIRRFF